MKETGEFYTYRELADELIPYVKSLGYTHIELLPLAEHPFDLSWGYQITGYFSVTARFGSPDDFKYFVDICHQENIGVIMDWVPGHFCKDDFALRQLTASPYMICRPSSESKKSWGTLTFDFGRPEVQSFLISNALFWFEEYHIDGLRVDAVASMLSLNFDKQEGEEKIYNSFGSEENLEAYSFIRKLNEVIFSYEPSALMMAEDSSDLPLVTAPTYAGGLGFNFKWNMGWMNDMLKVMKGILSSQMASQFTYIFVYVHPFGELSSSASMTKWSMGKSHCWIECPETNGSSLPILDCSTAMWAHPGKKLLFMGGELGQYAEWKDKGQLDWHLLDYPLHQALFSYVKALNHFYIENPELYEWDQKADGFEWIDPHNIDQSIIAFRRRSSGLGSDQ